MDTKLLGSILLIIGTSIGGGMLALPIATSQAGFISSSILLFGCWVIMTTSAFLILEVNLWLPQNSNIVSMAKATLGPLGQIIAWVTYLLLFYSLLSAYIAGGGDFFNNLFSMINIKLPSWGTSAMFTLALSYVVFQGIRCVDLVNRSFMLVKMGSLILLVAFIFPHIVPINLAGGEFKYITASITVALTSFGSANVIPSLRIYFRGDVKKLHLAILIGSFIPLVCYILWDAAIMGVIPSEGSNGLIAMLQSPRPNSEFVNVLSALLQRDTITAFARIFTSICLATSFLGVALSLTDFMADGLGLEKQGQYSWVIYAASFFPPLFIAIFYPGIFISALSYAGLYCVILLVLLPALMAWFGRYRKNIAKGYTVFGGKPLLIALVIVSFLIIGQTIIKSMI